MKNVKTLGIALGLTFALGAPMVASSSALADGEKLFKRCAACHSLEEGKKKVGPSLFGIVGRKAGTVDGYKYSDINKQASEAGLVWTKENLVAYLEDPQKFLVAYVEAAGMEPKKKTKMSFKLRKEDQRVGVVDYLAAQ